MIIFHRIRNLRIRLNMKSDKKIKKMEQNEKMADLFSLPQDIITGASNISVLGSMRVIIENYKGLLEYDKEKIVLQGKQSKIKILGTCLKIRCYNEEEIVIDGRIEGVLFYE